MSFVVPDLSNWAWNELPFSPELQPLSFWKFINPKLKYCNLKQATFAYFCLFFCILLQNQAKISKSCLLQIAIFQLWVDEFSKSQKQSFREGWELILSWRWVNFLNTQFFYKGKMSNLGVKSILEWRSLYVTSIFHCRFLQKGLLSCSTSSRGSDIFK